MEEDKKTRKKVKRILEIDRDRLEWEWFRQSDLAEEAAVEVVQAQDDLEDAERLLELCIAELQSKMRNRPDHYKIRKVTDKAIEMAIPLQSAYQGALQHRNECKRLVGLAKALVTGLEHKKRALEKAVDLLIFGYWSAPRTTKEREDHINSRIKKERRLEGEKKSRARDR
jgi:hypothetical protein